MNFIDTHCHIYSDNFSTNINNIIKNAKSKNVTKMICVGVDLSSSEKCIELAEKYEEIYATVGIHPHESEKVSSSYLKNIEDFCTHPKVVAIGEIGLDYYYNFSDALQQQNVFIEQILLAKDINLPVVIHNRNSNDDLYKIISKSNHSRGVIHCFTSNYAFAEKIINLGYYISFTGIVTFAKELESVVKKISLDKFLLETDSPYLSPVPLRGKVNEPANIPFIAKKISAIKDVDINTIAQQTTRNALTLFDKM